MQTIDPAARARIELEIRDPREKVLWADRPASSAQLHEQDAVLIPISLIYAAGVVIWEMFILGLISSPLTSTPLTVRVLGAFFGLSFVVLSQYMLWGRFLLAAWLNRRTFYGITDRCLVVVAPSAPRSGSLLPMEPGTRSHLRMLSCAEPMMRHNRFLSKLARIPQSYGNVTRAGLFGRWSRS